MKTLLAFLLSFGIAIFTSAQNWSPLVLDKTANFKLGNSQDITNCLWITDTVVEQNGDSCFILNRITRKFASGQLLIKNQPQFLLDKMRKQDQGVYVFSGDKNYVLKTQAPLGSIWVFDTTDNYTAGFTTSYKKNIFNVLDSVKLFTIYDNHEAAIGEIILSKNFGIIKFPVFETTNKHYYLCGFQNDTLGEQVITFWDIVDFSVGDVYEFHGKLGDAGEVSDFKKKYTITSKTITENSVTYDYEGYYYESGFDWVNYESFEYRYPISGQLDYVNTPESPTNRLPNSLTLMPNTYYYYYDSVNHEVPVYTVPVLLTSSGGTKVKGFGGFSKNTYVFFDDLDTLHFVNQYDNYSGLIYFAYAKHLGLIYSYSQHIEGYSKVQLVGYIKNGDTTGTITPDSVLVGTNPNENSLQQTVRLIPNPAHSNVRISIQGNINASWSFRATNLNGVTVIDRKDIRQKEASFDISKLSPGLYIYRIISQKEILHTGKFIKQ